MKQMKLALKRQINYQINTMNKLKTGLIAVGCLYAGAYISQNELQTRIEQRALSLANEYAQAYNEDDNYHSYDINFAWEDIEYIVHGSTHSYGELN